MREGSAQGQPDDKGRLLRHVTCGVVQGPVLGRAPCLVYYSAGAISKFLMLFDIFIFHWALLR